MSLQYSKNNMHSKSLPIEKLHTNAVCVWMDTKIFNTENRVFQNGISVVEVC